MFMMFAPDLGELAYCIGDAAVLSKEVFPVAPEGEAATLPINCAPETYFNSMDQRSKRMHCEEKLLFHMEKIQRHNSGYLGFPFVFR